MCAISGKIAMLVLRTTRRFTSGLTAQHVTCSPTKQNGLACALHCKRSATRVRRARLVVIDARAQYKDGCFVALSAAGTIIGMEWERSTFAQSIVGNLDALT